MSGAAATQAPAAAGAAGARPGRRVFKKASPNGKLTLYLGRRDFYETEGRTDSIDGVVAIDPAYVKERKVYAKVIVTVNLANDADYESAGMAVDNTIFSEVVQVYPPMQDEPLTSLQKKLKKKLGVNAYPFILQPPMRAPSSVIIEDVGAPGADASKRRRICGVSWEIVVYTANSPEERRRSRNSVLFSIRKLSYAHRSAHEEQQPTDEQAKKVGFGSSGSVILACKLAHEVFHHDEDIPVYIDIDNSSSKALKNIEMKVRQFAVVRNLRGAEGYTVKTVLHTQTFHDGFPIKPNTKVSRQFVLSFGRETIKKHSRLALDGPIHDEDTCLASSTHLSTATRNDEEAGIFVSYDIKIKAHYGLLGGTVSASLPFILTALKPDARKLSVNMDQSSLGMAGLDDSQAADPLKGFEELDKMLDNNEDGGLELVFEEYLEARAARFYQEGGENGAGGAGSDEDDANGNDN